MADKFEIDVPFFSFPKKKQEQDQEKLKQKIADFLDTDKKKATLFPTRFGIIPKGEGAAALGVELDPFLSPFFKRKLVDTLRKKGKLDEQDYLDGYDEIRKGLREGATNWGASFLKLGTIGLDYAFDTNLSKKIDDMADEALKDDKPDSFAGNLTSLLTEYAVPTSIATKLVGRASKIQGIRYLADKLRTTKASKYARRAFEGAAIVGVTDFLAGREGLPTIFSKTAEGMEPLEGLSGRKRAVAELRNKVRYGFEGTLVGFGFPLLGKSAQLGYKYLGPKFVLKTGLKYGSRGANNVVFRLPSYLLSKVPTNQLVKGVNKLTTYGTKKIINPLIKKAFGKNPFEQLPPFEKWRLFSVTSPSRTERNLKRFDNFLAKFRTYGLDPTQVGRFKESGQLFVRSRAKRFDKTIEGLESKAYQMAKAYEKRYNTNDTSQASEKYYLDQVVEYLEGGLKINQLPNDLRVLAKDLRDELNITLKEFANSLPADKGDVASEFKKYIIGNVNKYLVRSFSIFTKPNYVVPDEIKNRAAEWVVKNVVKRNIDLKEIAVNNYNKNRVTAEQSYRLYADDIVEDILAVGRTEGKNPVEILKKIGTKILRDDKYRFLKTGEELPDVIRSLLGQEKNLRTSVLLTTTDAVASSTIKTMFDRIAELGLKEGWLFKNADEARLIYKGAQQVDRIPGLGMMKSKLQGLWTSPEFVQNFRGAGGLLNRLMQSAIYRHILQFKTAVQAGKTVYSPTTQVRNVSSASIFSLASGHIGHGGSVTESMKIIFNDFAKTGKLKNEVAFNEYIEKMVKLGVLDENIVVTEMQRLITQMKEGKLNSIDKLFLSMTKGISEKASRLYAGGDNIWKIYGQQFEKSLISDVVKNIDEAIKYAKDIGYQVTKKDIVTGVEKSFDDILEEIAAKTIRDTYPTYSKVPPFIQNLKALPFSNFVSFSSEILRTSGKSLALRLKQIASDNPQIRQLGYRGLTGMYLAYGGIGYGAVKTSLTLTGTTEEQWDAYKRSSGAPWDKKANLLALEPFKNGESAAINFSYFSPYDVLEAPIQAALNLAAKQKINPQEVDSYVLSQLFGSEGPVMTLIDPFISESIGLERVQDVLGSGYLIGARGGITGTGKRIYSPSDTLDDKIEKSFAHIISGVAPGVATSGGKVIAGLRKDLSASGKQVSLQDELIALLSGIRIIRIDVKKDLKYGASEMLRLNRAADETEKFYTSANYMDRPPSVMVKEFKDIQDEAFRIQRDFYIKLKDLELLDLKKSTIRKILEDANISNKMIDNLLRGKFTPINYSKPRFETKVKNVEELIEKLNAKDKEKYRVVNEGFLYPKFEFNDVIRDYRGKKFFPYPDVYDPGKMPTEKGGLKKLIEKIPGIGPGSPFSGFGKPQSKLPTPPLPQTPQPQVQANTQQINPISGLTRSQQALLSPQEQVIAQKKI